MRENVKGKFNKKIIFSLIISIWIIFSIAYIANDVWQDFKVNLLTRSYNQGREMAIQQIIQESDKCQAFNIFNGEKSVDLISIKCLQEQQEKLEADTEVE